MAKDAKTKEKIDVLDKTSGFPKRGTKRRKKIEVRRPAGSFE